MLKLTHDELLKIQLKYSDLINYDSLDISDPIDPLVYKDSNDDSLLHIATIRGDYETVQALLEAGIDPNLLGDMGNTALHYANSGHQQRIISILENFGAKSDIENEFGITVSGAKAPK